MFASPPAGAKWPRFFRVGILVWLNLMTTGAILCATAEAQISDHPVPGAPQTPPPSSPASVAAPHAKSPDIATLFHQGEAALSAGDLDTAERVFRQIVALDPANAGGHANLSVVFMRRKQWPQAIAELSIARKLAPNVTGIRLNIGLAFYRQNDFRSALPNFESVLHDQPASSQARYLLGLSYFFLSRHADAARTLEPLWEEQSTNLNYLYVLTLAAGKSGQTALEEHASKQMLAVGQNSAEMHLIIGKAHLEREEYDAAVSELLQAIGQQPTLPFAHYFLGVTYRRLHEPDRALEVLLQEVALSPDNALAFDQLGAVLAGLENDTDAERYYRQALRLDQHLASSYFGLAKLLRKREKYVDALAALDSAAKLDPSSASVHYLKGQILTRLHRAGEARAELAEAARMKQAEQDDLERKVSGASVADPQLTGTEH